LSLVILTLKKLM